MPTTIKGGDIILNDPQLEENPDGSFDVSITIENGAMNIGGGDEDSCSNDPDCEDPGLLSSGYCVTLEIDSPNQGYTISGICIPKTEIGTGKKTITRSIPGKDAINGLPGGTYDVKARINTFSMHTSYSDWVTTTFTVEESGGQFDPSNLYIDESSMGVNNVGANPGDRSVSTFNLDYDVVNDNDAYVAAGADITVEDAFGNTLAQGSVDPQPRGWITLGPNERKTVRTSVDVPVDPGESISSTWCAELTGKQQRE